MICYRTCCLFVYSLSIVSCTSSHSYNDNGVDDTDTIDNTVDNIDAGDTADSDTDRDTNDGVDSGADTGSDSDAVFECAEEHPERTVGLITCRDGASRGYTLFAPNFSTTTYLIDMSGRLVHEWPSEYKPGMSTYLLENGDLLRTAHKSEFGGAFTGGGVQRIAWDGTLVWDFEYLSEKHYPHHDIEPLPNGNVLILAWEIKTQAEVAAAGGVSDGDVWSEHIVEIEPTGLETGRIVWEWHLWDHLVQHNDPSKSGFGLVAEHPELLDIGTIGQDPDWIHGNAVAYNAVLDQIVINSRHLSEFWVIDHSTTAAEAAGHTGGLCGWGGDILYRWGNPKNYGADDQSKQTLFSQHDAHWIGDGLPGQGNILVFNNGDARAYSTIEEIAPPVTDEGQYPRPGWGEAFGPKEPNWTYEADPPQDFFAHRVSGAQRLPNGNTLICQGPEGTLFEVTPEGETVWKYVNPVGPGGPIKQGAQPEKNGLFRSYRYSSSYAAFADKDLIPGDNIELSTD